MTSPDLPLVHEDDLLLDALGGGATPTDDQLVELLAQWRRELVDATPADDAPDAVVLTLPSRDRRGMRHGITTAAIMTALFAGGGVAAAAVSGPHGPLGGLHRLLFGTPHSSATTPPPAPPTQHSRSQQARPTDVPTGSAPRTGTVRSADSSRSPASAGRHHAVGASVPAQSTAPGDVRTSAGPPPPTHTHPAPPGGTPGTTRLPSEPPPPRSGGGSGGGSGDGQGDGSGGSQGGDGSGNQGGGDGNGSGGSGGSGGNDNGGSGSGDGSGNGSGNGSGSGSGGGTDSGGAGNGSGAGSGSGSGSGSGNGSGDGSGNGSGDGSGSGSGSGGNGDGSSN